MRFALSLCALVGAVAATPSAAEKKPNLEGEQVVAQFARCVVREAPQEAASLLATELNSAAERLSFDSLAQRHAACIQLPPSLMEASLAAQVRLGQLSLSSALQGMASAQRQMTVSERAFRGAIAERLYLTQVKSAPANPASINDAGRWDASLPLGYAVVSCAAGRDPVAADRLVRAKRLSPAEADAAKALAPALQECGRGRGHVDISGTAIHGWTAEALYHQQGAAMAQRR